MNTISRYRWWRSQKLLMMTTNDGDGIKSLLNPISLFLVCWPDQRDFGTSHIRCVCRCQWNPKETRHKSTYVKTLISMLWLLLLVFFLHSSIHLFARVLLFNIRFQATPNNGNEEKRIIQYTRFSLALFRSIHSILCDFDVFSKSAHACEIQKRYMHKFCFDLMCLVLLLPPLLLLLWS